MEPEDPTELLQCYLWEPTELASQQAAGCKCRTVKKEKWGCCLARDSFGVGSWVLLPWKQCERPEVGESLGGRTRVSWVPVWALGQQCAFPVRHRHASAPHIITAKRYNRAEDSLVCRRGGQIKQDSQTSIVLSYNVTACFSLVEHFTLVSASWAAVGVTLVMSVFISRDVFSVTFPSADWPAGHAPGDLHCCHSSTSSVLLFPCPLWLWSEKVASTRSWWSWLRVG